MSNVLSIVPQILIFASLGVIIYIFAKKIPQLRELSRRKEEVSIAVPSARKELIVRIIRAAGSRAKGLFVWIAEGLVKKTKKLLHLVHFWLIKIKKGKKEDDAISEIEAKQELIMEEEKNLEKVINEDLGQQEVAGISIFREERTEEMIMSHENGEKPESVIIEQESLVIEDYAEVDVKDDKIEEFFGAEREDGQYSNPVVAETEAVTEKKTGFFKKFWKKKEKPDQWKEDIYTFPSEPVAPKLPIDEFPEIVAGNEVTEGIIRIEKKPLDGADIEREKGLKEVVTVKRKADETDPDDELGIDRRILEKKIIQKITKNPRDPENYRQLGELYIKMKEYTDAEESYKQILKLTPRDIDAKRKLEKIKLLKRLR